MSSPPPQRLTLEEKLWFDRRKSELQQFAGFGAAVGAATGAAVTSFWPFPRRMQLATMAGMVMIGGGVGYLYAESQALARVQDLSATSQLRKQYQQLALEKKATKKQE